MTEILSYSQHGVFEGLPPAFQQKKIYERMHDNREAHIHDARRARDYQTRIAELEIALREIEWSNNSEWQSLRARAALRK